MAKRKKAAARAPKAKTRKMPTKKKTKKAKTVTEPGRKRKVSTFKSAKGATSPAAATFETSLTSNVCDRVLACIRSITGNDNITYTTNLCEKYHWNAKSWKHLADRIAACFQAAGHPLPRPISKPAIVQCCTVSQVCTVVEATYR